MSYGTVQAEKMTTESGYSLGAGNASSFKNRIINGGMVIDQRNAGATVTPTDNSYTLDRWCQRVSGTGVYTVQQSTTVPTGQGFVNSIQATVTTADSSIAAGDIYSFLYKIEGYNTSDLMWGTANAKTLTLSFWVRSSQTGTYSVGFTNIAANRGYAATYTINAADTWEYKTITITGDTTGTWNTNNLCSIQISFCLSCGTDRTEPAGSWSANNVQGADGTFNWMATSGATFYMTGVQFEVGTVATSFDFRSYGTEFGLCERYCQTIVSPSAGFMILPAVGGITASNNARLVLPYSEMRAPPTATFASAGSFLIQEASGTVNRNVTAVGNISTPGVNSMGIDFTISGASTGQPAWVYANGVSGLLITLSAEL